MNKIIALCVAFVAMLGFSLVAQVQVISAAPIESDAPVVPIEVAVKGRQAVISYLSTNIDYIVVRVKGKSIMTPDGWNDHYFFREDLRCAGYIDDGSFDQLMRAIGTFRFNARVLPTTDGGYDVQLEIDIYNVDGKKPFSGWGRVPVILGEKGTVFPGQSESYVYLNDYVLADVGERVNGAMWIDDNGVTHNLSTCYIGNEKFLIQITSDMLGNGHLALTQYDGNVVVVDMKTGSRMDADGVYNIMSSVRFPDVVIQDLKANNWGEGDGNYFWRSTGQVYGRFALRELVLPKEWREVSVKITVPVWGANMSVAPSHVYVTPIRLDGPSKYSVGTESEIKSLGGGVWEFSLPRGIYHLRAVFDNVKDVGGKV